MDLSQNKSIAILKAAEIGKYGVPSIVCHSFEHIIATVRAAESKRSPAMVMLFPTAIQQYGPLLVNLAAEACKSASVPVALHLDHQQDEEGVKYAASLPFDSIMIDMSHFEKSENLQKTMELTKYCHARGIATEAEPGRIEGGEDGVLDTGDLEKILTTPEIALEFVETGVDFLAPAIGNIHGAHGLENLGYDFHRLATVRQAVGSRVQLVLHGTSGDFEVEECVKNGVTKINLNRHLQPWNEFMKSETTFLPVTKLMEKGIDIMQKEIERLCDLCKSSGRA